MKNHSEAVNPIDALILVKRELSTVYVGSTLLPGKTNLTVQRSVRGSVIRLWRLKSEILGCEGCETCDDDH